MNNIKSAHSSEEIFDVVSVTFGETHMLALDIHGTVWARGTGAYLMIRTIEESVWTIR